MTAESKLEAARAKGDLTGAIGALREQAREEAANATPPAREQLGLEDATIRVAAGLTGKSDVERRAALREVRPGSTVSAQGSIAKTQLTREQKLARVKTWASTLTEEQRTEYLTSDSFDRLSDRAAEIISEVFGDLEERTLEDSLGIQNVDLDAETPTVDSIIGEEDDNEDEVVDDSDYEAMFEQAAWEAEQTS